MTRVRFAPSPTGALHIGGVRTALYNFLFARQNGGQFLLRIEDTDSTRFVPGAEEYILQSLDWLGISIDEGLRWENGRVVEIGNHGPYRQSERRDIYHRYVDQLIQSGRAYYAFDTPAELEAKRAEIANFQYDARTRMQMVNSLTLPADEVAARIQRGDVYVVRFRVEPDQDVHVHDLIRGEVVISSNILDDKVLYKSADDLPTYHLANIVDDHLMEITHVIRGEEWLPSAPLHVLLYQAFGWEDTMPAFAHLPLLLKPDGNGKLSKRDGDRLGFPVFPLEFHHPIDGTVSSGYRESGYYPEAVINFLALLGWHSSSDQELFTMDELIAQFSLDRVSKSGAKFDYEKGKWFNREYLLRRSNEQLAAEFLPILLNHLKPSETPETPETTGSTGSTGSTRPTSYTGSTGSTGPTGPTEVGAISSLPLQGVGGSLDSLPHIVSLVRDRVNFVSELWEQTSFFFVAPDSYDEKSLAKRWKPESPAHMRELYKVLDAIPEADWHFSGPCPEDLPLNSAVMAWIAAQSLGVGIVMNAFRITLVGAARGPHIWEITNVLGKEETLRRLNKAISRLA